MNDRPAGWRLLSILALLTVAAGAARADEPRRDPRDIREGLVVPDEGYCDQPYVVVMPDGSWLCVMTTGRGEEGQGGQHVVSTVSRDRGRTWSPRVDIEPADGPEASWAVPYLAPYGRVYVFYDYNGDRVDRIGDRRVRADMLGWYVFRYSDDGGRTWSARHLLPLPVAACDRGNDWQGRVQLFWGVCKPQSAEGRMLFAFTRLGRHLLEQGEGWIYRSDRIDVERDPARLDWKLLPDRERGLRLDRFGSVQEEHNLVPLGDGHWFCAYRTTNGFPCQVYGSDDGARWEEPEPMRYAPGGRVFKHPRACPRLFRTAEGRYLFWFHHHGGGDFRDRNPAWISGGTLVDGRLRWSQPEILLYDRDPQARMSYPDLIEQEGRVWISETQKTTARIHAIDPRLLQGLWTQGTDREVSAEGRLVDVARPKGETVPFASRFDLRTGRGFTVEFRVRFRGLDAGRTLLDSRNEEGAGFVVTTSAEKTLRVALHDGRRSFAWECDRGLLGTEREHHVAFVVDAGPRIVTCVVDGVLCDGGERRFGWGRWTDDLGDVAGTGRLGTPGFDGELARLRLYDRPLRTAEAVAHFRSGR